MLDVLLGPSMSLYLCRDCPSPVTSATAANSSRCCSSCVALMSDRRRQKSVNNVDTCSADVSSLRRTSTRRSQRCRSTVYNSIRLHTIPTSALAEHNIEELWTRRRRRISNIIRMSILSQFYFIARRRIAKFGHSRRRSVCRLCHSLTLRKNGETCTPPF